MAEPFYKTQKDPKACSVSKPFAVKKTNDGTVVPGGCHVNRSQANDHRDALNQNVKRKEQASVVRGLFRGRGR